MSQPEPARNRRDFLKLAATTAPAAALAVTAAPADTAPVVKRSDRGDACMQDTAHTRRYYELARF